jgi:hypothetical protein
VKATAQIFLSYAREDEEKVENLYQKLSDAGFKPWMDKKDILPGEMWKSSVQKAIRHSGFFLVCLSANSIDKRGWIQREIRDALDIWQAMLDSDIYLIPVRLEDCEVPERLRDFQWVKLFEEDGWTRLVKAIQVGMERRAEIVELEQESDKAHFAQIPVSLKVKAMVQIFLSYTREDEEKVENLYQKLSDAGFKPWMAKKDILPGESWKSSIQRAIQRSDFFLACLSANSVKRGFMQKEHRDALDIWQKKLDSDIYLIPVRLEDCEVPERLRDFQWVNLFEEDGWTRLVKAIQVGMERRAEVIRPIVQEEEGLERIRPTEWQDVIEELATKPERRAAQEAQIELDARRLERCVTVMAIGDVHQSLAAGSLEGPISALLRSFTRLSQDVNAALHQESAYNQRLALRVVEERLDGLVQELRRSDEHYALRFRPIATDWRRIVTNHIGKLAQKACQEIDNPYVIGVPLTAEQEIFVGRADIGARIEQLLLDRRRPPLLLYGQRRTGKTSLLNNLGRLLPSTIVPLFVDLQGPVSLASDYAGFLYNTARGMVDSAERQRNLALPLLPREALVADPFTRFDEWLDQVEGVLGQNTALLALDEFEALDSAIAKGRFDEEAVLGTLRHLIQHRPCFKVLLAGSHTLDEVQRWASYLINVQVVHISYLKEAEARQLVERPVTDFSLRYEPEASQRVLDLTRGHPALVQLLCAEIVALKNEQPLAIRRSARLADVEAAVPEALSHGSFFFADIQQNQVDAAGLALLRFLAAQGEEAVVSRDVLARHFLHELDRTLDLLTRRELIEPADGGYRFQVEMIRRWFTRSRIDSQNI